MRLGLKDICGLFSIPGDSTAYRTGVYRASPSEEAPGVNYDPLDRQVKGIINNCIKRGYVLENVRG